MKKENIYENTVALLVLFQGASAWDELPEPILALNEHGERELIPAEKGVDTLTHD